MEHSCHKCGRPVEDGVPFCSQCAAPQIRVAMPEPPPALVTENQAVMPPVSIGVERSPFSPGIPLSPGWANALRPCAGAALIAALAISLGMVLPVAVVGGGFLAVVLYRRGAPGTAIRAGTGARLGAISGIFCFGIAAVFLAVAAAVSDTWTKLREQMIEAVQKAASRSGDPQVQAAMEHLKTPEGLAMMLVLSGILFFLLFILFASLGGALGGAFLSRRDRTSR